MSTPAPGILLTDAQRLDWLRLIRSDNIGPRTFRTLINRYGTAAKALEALPEIAGRMARPIRIAKVGDIEQEMEDARHRGVRLIGMGEPDYPAILREIDSAPPILAVRGQVAALAGSIVALVGSRNASAAGLAFTERLARGVAQAGHIVVSGLARGIDARAHRSTLRTGTVAVLAGGHNRIYPSEHEALVDEILEFGAVISEMPLGWEPRGRDFPRRNRLVSGLSLAVVIVEAARNSGSLITAKFAAEQGREVFAVPGSPLDPRAEGTNDLLRNGATLCTDPQDILNVVEPMLKRPHREPDLFREPLPLTLVGDPLWDELELSGNPTVPVPTSAPMLELDEPLAQPPYRQQVRSADEVDVAAQLVSLLGPSPISVDELARAAGVPMAALRGALLSLELEGRLERHGANLVSLLTR